MSYEENIEKSNGLHESDELLQLVSFNLGEEIFGVDILGFVFNEYKKMYKVSGDLSIKTFKSSFDFKDSIVFLFSLIFVTRSSRFSV